MSTVGDPGDLADHVHRGVRAVDQIVVHGHVAHRRVGVAIADREDGAAVLHGPFEEAALRREIHNVVLVDPRRAGQQRYRVDLLRLRRVLDELHQVVAVHDLARRRRKVAAHLEKGAGVDLAGPSAVLEHVVDEVADAGGDTQPAGLGRPAQRGGVAEQEDGPRHGVDEEVPGEPRLAVGDRVLSTRVEQIAAQLGDGEIRLAQCEKVGVLRPRSIGEAAVVGIHRQWRIARVPDHPGEGS